MYLILWRLAASLVQMLSRILAWDNPLPTRFSTMKNSSLWNFTRPKTSRAKYAYHTSKTSTRISKADQTTQTKESIRYHSLTMPNFLAYLVKDSSVLWILTTMVTWIRVSFSMAFSDCTAQALMRRRRWYLRSMTLMRMAWLRNTTYPPSWVPYRWLIFHLRKIQMLLKESSREKVVASTTSTNEYRPWRRWTESSKYASVACTILIKTNSKR